MEIELKKFTTPIGRVSYPWMFKPQPNMEGNSGPPQFGLTLIIDSVVDIKKVLGTSKVSMETAIINAITEKFGPDRTKWPPMPPFKLPIRNGKEKPNRPELQGKFFFKLSSKDRPGLIDQKRNPITEESGIFYAGCYAHAVGIASYFNQRGNQGIRLTLQNVQKAGDGERLGGRRDAASEFGDIDTGENNADNYSLLGGAGSGIDLGLG